MCHAVPSRSAMAKDTAPASSALELLSPWPHLRRERASFCYICAGTGLAAATSAPGHGASLPHLHWNWAHRCHICAWTSLILATFATLLGSLPPHPDSAQSPASFPVLGTYALNLQGDRVHPCRIFTGTGVTPAASVPERGSSLPDLHRDSANPAHINAGAGPFHICAGTCLNPAASMPALGSPRADLRRD